MSKTNPHDALFKATLSHPSEVEALVRGFLPTMISENLDFATLQMENTAYISADLRDYFSDVSYSCHWKADADKPPAQITLLLEHNPHCVASPVSGSKKNIFTKFHTNLGY